MPHCEHLRLCIFPTALVWLKHLWVQQEPQSRLCCACALQFACGQPCWPWFAIALEDERRMQHDVLLWQVLPLFTCHLQWSKTSTEHTQMYVNTWRYQYKTKLVLRWVSSLCLMHVQVWLREACTAKVPKLWKWSRGCRVEILPGSQAAAGSSGMACRPAQPGCGCATEKLHMLPWSWVPPWHLVDM